MKDLSQYREKAKRGTVDFPFEHYTMKNKDNYNNMAEPHWHPEIEICYVTKGEIVVTVSDERYILKPNDIFFINPEELHSITPNVLPVEYHAAVFSASLFEFKETHFFEENFTEPLKQRALIFPRLITKAHPFYNQIEHYLTLIFTLHTTSKPLIFSDLIGLFTLLLENSLMSRQAENLTDKHSDDIKLCINYIEKNYTEKIKLSELADLVHMSSNYFCNYFKNYTGMSPFTHINYIRIKKATSLLLKSSDSIVNIAENCGFENVSFFTRKFKEIMGCTPSVYRKKHLKN